ncbi:hypothetical protein [uncultured Methanobrevibacter sp.]|uniref:hypothetical protein n=1 Tax=uncultured Methanobrevibacter sp. TaxID=253161 RepID=UPI0025ED9AD5|nr:hypothetical protein [uncultured Methanobrevibacter sp.]
MKKSNKLVLVIISITILSIFLTGLSLLVDDGFITFHKDTKYLNDTDNKFDEIVEKLTGMPHDKSIIGYNENGTVRKYIMGNTSSNDTVVVILGVHDLESGIHNATNKTLKEFNDNNQLKKKYVVYFVKINHDNYHYDTEEYNTNRHMGEMLANEFIVPDVKQYSPNLVIDVHEMEVYFDETNFVLAIGNDNLTQEESIKLAEMIGVNQHPGYSSGTSPEYVTEPIKEQGYTTMLFEINQGYSKEQKENYARRLVTALDAL